MSLQPFIEAKFKKDEKRRKHLERMRRFQKRWFTDLRVCRSIWVCCPCLAVPTCLPVECGLLQWLPLVRAGGEGTEVGS